MAYAKIREQPLALILKLADRIANVEASALMPDKLKMHCAEWESFCAALGGSVTTGCGAVSASHQGWNRGELGE